MISAFTDTNGRKKTSRIAIKIYTVVYIRFNPGTVVAANNCTILAA